MSFKYVSHVDKVLTEIQRKDTALLRKAGTHLRGAMARKIRKRHVSEPGQAPGRQTGNLLRGLRRVTKKTVSLVGFIAPAYHALLLEFGTSKMAPRPILYPTIQDELETLKSILSGQRVK